MVEKKTRDGRQARPLRKLDGSTEIRSLRFHDTQFLAQPSLRFFLLALLLDARLFVIFTLLHLTEKPFLLKFALQNANRLLDVVIDNMDFQLNSPHSPADFFSISRQPRHENVSL